MERTRVSLVRWESAPESPLRKSEQVTAPKIPLAKIPLVQRTNPKVSRKFPVSLTTVSIPVLAFNLKARKTRKKNWDLLKENAQKTRNKEILARERNKEFPQKQGRTGIIAMDTQTAKAWISAADAQTSVFLGFLGIHWVARNVLGTHTKDPGKAGRGRRLCESKLPVFRTPETHF